jgi:uncharacterized hydrophobic protein (TIGR00271 family)
MASHLFDRMLPTSQRRTVDELTGDLDLGAGDSRAKTSAFWTMLILSAVIASAGVISDSTATVIGAMIIAPLSTPIMGVGLGIVRRSTSITRRSAVYTVLGALAVVAIGSVFSLAVPGGVDLLHDSQIASRTSPGLVDLVSAVATGLAGAVAFARRDVAAVLPGVAIAISLVPPLAVVGVCLGQGAVALALGALVLFVSNFVALVLSGSLLFTSAGYVAEAPGTTQLSRRRANLAIGLLLVVVLVPMAANTVGAYLVDRWTQRVQSTATAWIGQESGARITSVTVHAKSVYIEVQTPGALPPTTELVSDLQGQIPNGIPVIVTTTVGTETHAGVVGDSPSSDAG